MTAAMAVWSEPHPSRPCDHPVGQPFGTWRPCEWPERPHGYDGGMWGSLKCRRCRVGLFSAVLAIGAGFGTLGVMDRVTAAREILRAVPDDDPDRPHFARMLLAAELAAVQ